jgi:NTE family protein
VFPAVLRRHERDHADGWFSARRPPGSAKAAHRFLALGQQHRRFAADAARRCGTAAVVHAGRRLAGASLVRPDGALFSPYDFNPLNINPLKDLVERFVDFKAVQSFADIQLFISATNVQTGRVRIFPREKITADAVMASACLPELFRAVEIDGVPYWDGGYLGNPVIFPFFGTTQTEDVLVVQINPLVRQKTPTSAGEIMNRLNEITFNSPLIAEYRAMEFVARLIDQGRLPRGVGPGQYRRINVHRIVLDRFGTQLDASSRLTTDYDFFEMLRTNGKRAARRFLDEHFADIGVKSTVDLRAEAQAEWA